jgi:hypothetical protein
MRINVNVSFLALVAAAGIAPSTLAGLTWNFSNPGNSADYAFGNDEQTFVSGAPAMGLVTASQGLDSIAVSAVSSSGFTASAVTPNEFGVYVNAGRFFSVDGTVDLAMSGSGWAFCYWNIYDHSNLDEFGNATMFAVAFGEAGEQFSGTVTLGTGVYAVEMLAHTYSLDGTVNASTTFAIVPAPGALALLGAAGLIGARRRRA